MLLNNEKVNEEIKEEIKKTRPFGLNRIETVHNLKIMSGNTDVGSPYFPVCEGRKIEIHRKNKGR